ncbi:MAG: ankyrin repeat domain-containing protein [Exiguobacterium sp.]
MLGISQSFRRHDYEEARQQLYRTPKETLCKPEETILHVAVSFCDDGSATKITIEQGYGYLVGTRASKFHNQTPLHIVITRDNIHAFTHIKSLLGSVEFSQDVCDECVLLAVTYGREHMMSELVEHLNLSPSAQVEAFKKAIDKKYVLSAVLLFKKYPASLSSLIHAALVQILRRKTQRKEMMEIMHLAVDLWPSLKSWRTPDTKRTLLHTACAYKSPEAIAFAKSLIDDARLLAEPDGDGYNPLQIAYRNSNKECLKMLLAVPNCPVRVQCTPHGQTILSYVLDCVHTDVWDAMIIGNPQLIEDQYVAMSMLMNKNIHAFERAIQTHPKIASVRTFHGRNLLMVAILRQLSKRHIDLIFDYGEFDIDAQDDEGNTALHYAVSNNNRDAIDRILAMHSNSSIIRNSTGGIPLDVYVGDDWALMAKMLSVDKYVHFHATKEDVEMVKSKFPGFTEYIETPPSMLELVLYIGSSRIKTLRH